MSVQQLAKQMETEEKAAAAEIAKAVTEALNSKSTKAEADKINQSSGGWPYAPTSKMLKLYDKVAKASWAKQKSGYSGMKVEIKVEANKGKAPSAKVTAKYDGDWKGGSSVELRAGDTVASIAKREYGYECYAEQVWLHNAKVLGAKCTQVPAGFGIQLPRIWVPAWKKAPKASFPAGAKSPAVKVLYPTVAVDVEKKGGAKTLIPMGIWMVELSVELTGAFKAQKQGAVGAGFNLRTYQAEVKQAAGPIEAAYKFNLKEKNTELEIQVVNTKWKDLELSTSCTIKEGSFALNFKSKKVSKISKGVLIEGELVGTISVRLWPNPAKVRVVNKVRVKRGLPEIDPKTADTLIFVGALGVAALVLVPVAIAVGPVVAGALTTAGGTKLLVGGGAATVLTLSYAGS